MAVNLNKLNHKIFEDFMVKHQTPGAPKTEISGAFRSQSYDLFAHLDTKKTIVGYLRTIGLDPFKKGTKEPAAITEALSKVTWDDIKDGPKGGQSMFDQGSRDLDKSVHRILEPKLEEVLANNQTELYPVKWFNPNGRGYWFGQSITEWRLKKQGDFKAAYSLEDKANLLNEGWVLDDVIVYGYVSLYQDHNDESGDFSLKELAEIVGPVGLGIEIDKHYYPKSLEEIKQILGTR